MGLKSEAEITTCYNPAMQKSILLNLEADGLQQQMTTPGMAPESTTT